MLTVLLVTTLLAPGLARAAEQAPLVLLVQPVLNEEQTRKAFQPLCDFIAKQAGRTCRVHTAPNFLAYWHMIQRNQGIDFVMDAAHFTDYRAQKQGYIVQEQTWFLAELLDGEGSIHFRHEPAEFDAFRWVKPEEALALTVPFKAAAYREGLAALGLLDAGAGPPP